jgi:hypothetical protein
LYSKGIYIDLYLNADIQGEVEGDKTYKKPKQKIPKTINFCRAGSWSLYTEDIGMQKIRTSVAKLKPDEKYQTGRVLRQKPLVLGKIMPIGRHESARRVVCTQAQTITNSIAPKQTLWMVLDWKIRRYWNRNEILTMFMPKL